MVLADFGRALVLGAVAAAGLAGVLGLPVLLEVVFATGALSVFFDVAYQASLARLVKRFVRTGARWAAQNSSAPLRNSYVQ
ncbi:hypothetical protein [Streptomyces sp. NPDC002403]